MRNTIIIGDIDDTNSFKELTAEGVWKKAFDWLLSNKDDFPTDGEYEIAGHDVRAIVQTVLTENREARVFESHRREIDLHYCFDGSEVIEYVPFSKMRSKTDYDEEKDFILYDTPLSTEKILMRSGSFAIFFPEDGHMPGVRLDHEALKKVVIKIRLGLLEDEKP